MGRLIDGKLGESATSKLLIRRGSKKKPNQDISTHQWIHTGEVGENVFNLLLEDDDNYLLETGDVILLEG